jgi:hypothetical protein
MAQCLLPAVMAGRDAMIAVIGRPLRIVAGGRERRQ